jgi:uncharacterized cupin superfamily protein
LNQIIVSRSDLALQAAPIEPSWVLDGQPQARNRVISKSQDGTAFTLLWECTAGVFNWRYDLDETIHVTQGEATIADAAGVRQIKAGDLVFFPAGSTATWTVDRYIRKVAFFRRALPRPIALLARAWERLSLAARRKR